MLLPTKDAAGTQETLTLEARFLSVPTVKAQTFKKDLMWRGRQFLFRKKKMSLGFLTPSFRSADPTFLYPHSSWIGPSFDKLNQ